MPLNLSGPISLAGATTGESIAVELGLSSSGTITLDQANVRSLAGVPSGAITMPTNFYGKSAGSLPTVAMFYANSCGGGGLGGNIVTRINACAALIGFETTLTFCNICTNNIPTVGAGLSSSVALFARTGNASFDTIARINACGNLIGSRGSMPWQSGTRTTARNAGARTGANLLVWGCGCSLVGYATRVNSCMARVGSETIAGPSSQRRRGVASRQNESLFYNLCTNASVNRINACGTFVGSTTTAGTVRGGANGAQIGANACRNGGLAVFYGGCSGGNGTLATRINACGALVGSAAVAGATSRTTFSGAATVSTVGIYYNRVGTSGIAVRRATRINMCGTLVGSEVANLGTNRVNPMSSSL